MVERVVIKDIEKNIKDLNKINYVKKNHIIRYQYALSILKKGDLVLDIACGSGYGSKMLALHGCKVIGIDQSSEAINLCKKYNNHKNITWIQEKIENFQNVIKNKLDGIVCFETLEHLEKNHEKILEQFNKKLKKTKPAICSIPLNHPDTIWHKKIFSFEDREKLFQNVFKKIEYSKKNKSIIVGWNI